MTMNTNPLNNYTGQSNDMDGESKPTLNQLLLKKITESNSHMLKRVVEIVAPDNTFWSTQIFVEDFSPEVVNALIELFEITEDDYYQKE